MRLKHRIFVAKQAWNKEEIETVKPTLQTNVTVDRYTLIWGNGD